MYIHVLVLLLFFCLIFYVCIYSHILYFIQSQYMLYIYGTTIKKFEFVLRESEVDCRSVDPWSPAWTTVIPHPDRCRGPRRGTRGSRGHRRTLHTGQHIRHRSVWNLFVISYNLPHIRHRSVWNLFVISYNLPHITLRPYMWAWMGVNRIANKAHIYVIE